MAQVERLDALGAHVAREEELLVDPLPDHETLRSALAAHVANVRPRRRFRWIALGGLSISAAAALAVFSMRGRHQEELRFFVGAAHVPGEVGRFMAAPEGGRLPIAFSDGTAVTLAEGAQGRVVSLSPFGADVVVEQGRASIAVVPRTGNRWEVSTGPFVVHVTGTRFDVEWHPERDRFVLSLYEGHVRISGCAGGDDHAIQAGERVEASCRTGEFRVAPIQAKNEVEGRETASLLPAPVAPPEDRTASGSASTPGAAKTPEVSSWIDKARQGRYTAAFAAAVNVFEDVCTSGSERDLLLLSDTARLSGHLVEAARAYEAVRGRFPGTDGAALAAFELGRQDFDQRREYSSASRWLRVYLDEEPRGAFAQAAMGRLMEAEIVRGRAAQARAIAGQYVARYPRGPHADAARRVLSTPDDNPPPR